MHRINAVLISLRIYSTQEVDSIQQWADQLFQVDYILKVLKKWVVLAYMNIFFSNFLDWIYL